ncbi:MAG: DUF3369 domain-containing protein [Desulfobacteraceae bacterium]|jgi:response regulator RpfG family c-di-GMP phosphodiesterase
MPINNEDDFMFFADDEPNSRPESEIAHSSNNIDTTKTFHKPAWKLLVVDDEKDIHQMTKLVLAQYTFENLPLEIISAFSAKEAIKILTTENDIALILLDVVMETDHAGLDCVKAIREELKNRIVRIILRTGQPGQAPEHEVIVNYDINGYKAKTELTAQKMFTSVTTSLRSYQYIRSIEKSKRGLEKIIKASNKLYERQSFNLFVTGILQQLTSLLCLDDGSGYANVSSISAIREGEDNPFIIIAATGRFKGKENNPIKEVISEQIHNKLIYAAKKQESVLTEDTYTVYFDTQDNRQHILYLQWQRSLTRMERDLITLFGTNISIAFENLSLNNEILLTQKDVIFTMSEIVEGRSKETGNHIRRVAAVSGLLARKIGLNSSQVELIELAAPMHDIGKIGTPEAILHKPGKLTKEEYEIMKEHTTLGKIIFESSQREIMKAAAIIAHEHHEKWNGSGYPRGLKEKEIHLYGRIVALADVVDALISKRCYKEPWTMEQVLKTIQEERGQHFDPKLVDVFLDSLEEYQQIRERYPI